MSTDFHQTTPIKTLKKCGRLCCQFILRLVSITHIISATNQIAGLSFLSSAVASYCLIFDLQLLNKFLFLFSLEFEFKVEGKIIADQATALNVKFQEKILKIDTTVESHDATLTFIMFRQD